jgi:carboxyl-terminal processing protease|tara:strand:- start:45638 stop:47749 length:2112 start_codon:yes stop_codon:yes gene_type:complete
MRQKLLLILYVSIFACSKAQDNAAYVDELLILAPLPEHSEVLFVAITYLEQYHYRKMQIDDSLSSVIFDNYINSLDPSKSFLLKSDIDFFDKYRYQLDDELSTNELSFGFQFFNYYRDRLLQRYQSIPVILEKGFDFEKDEVYEIRENKDWHDSYEALDEEWRLIIKSQALNLILANKTYEEAKKILLDRNERRIKAIYQNNSEDVFQVYLNAITSIYDPHTSYFSPATSENFQINMSLSLEGIGARLGQQLDYTYVASLVPGGPVFKSKKIFENDKIIGVGQGEDGDFEDVIGWRLDDVVSKIRGPKGTVVRIVILAKGDLNVAPDTVLLVREKIKLEDESAKGEMVIYTENKVTYNIGVISLPSFYIDFDDRSKGIKNYKSTTRDVKLLLDSLNGLGMDGLVIDLRYNGGGSLDEAVDLTGLFIPNGPVVQVRNTDDKIEALYDDDDDEIFYTGPLAVLTNRYSASASEIFSGAIQDYKRGIILGENSYGKGTVQSLLGLERPVSNYLDRMIAINQFNNNDLVILRDKLKNNEVSLGQLKMTLAKFYRASGSSTQRLGVKPDIDFPVYYDPDDLGESSSPSALPWDEIKSASFQPTNDVSEVLLETIRVRYARDLKEDPQLVDLVKDINDQKQKMEETQLSLNLSNRQKEADDNSETKKMDTVIAQSELSFTEKDREKITKDPYLKESIKLVAEWIKFPSK